MKQKYNETEASIIKGLKEAIAFARGEETGAITSIMQVPIVNVHRARDSLGLTQKQFAQAFGVSVSTVRNWEQGRRTPSGAAKVLLNVIEQSPETVKRALRYETRLAA